MKRHVLLAECLLFLASAIAVVIGACVYIVPQMWTLSYLERLGLALSIPAAFMFYLGKSKSAWDQRRLDREIEALLKRGNRDLLMTLPRIRERVAERDVVENEEDRRA